MKENNTPPKNILESKDVTPLDAFAAYAMNGLLSSGDNPESEHSIGKNFVENIKDGNGFNTRYLCKLSYDIAEAMIAERQKRIHKQNQK